MKKEKIALILPYSKNSEILFQNRKKISKNGEEYGFFGGHFEENENAEQTIVREIKEELNLNINEIKIEFFKKFQFKLNENLLVELHIFLTKISNLRKIKAYEGEIIIKNFKDIFELNLDEIEKQILKESIEFIKTK